MTEPVGAICDVDWGPVIHGLNAVLLAIAGLASTYAVSLLRRNGYRVLHPEEKNGAHKTLDV